MRAVLRTLTVVAHAVQRFTTDAAQLSVVHGFQINTMVLCLLWQVLLGDSCASMRSASRAIGSGNDSSCKLVERCASMAAISSFHCSRGKLKSEPRLSKVRCRTLSPMRTDSTKAKREVVGSVLGSGFDFADEHELIIVWD